MRRDMHAGFGGVVYFTGRQAPGKCISSVHHVISGSAVVCRMIDIDLSTLEAETRCPVCLGVPPACLSRLLYPLCIA